MSKVGKRTGCARTPSASRRNCWVAPKRCGPRLAEKKLRVRRAHPTSAEQRCMAPARGCHRPPGGGGATTLGVVLRQGRATAGKIYETPQESLRPVSGSVVRVPPMRNGHMPSEVTMTEIIDGPIPCVDRVYAFERIRG